MQIALPGVQKDAIQMKALEDYFQLRAKRETIEYVLDLEFGMKVEPEHTKAVYEEGLLRLEFKKYKPLEHAYEVPIQ